MQVLTSMEELDSKLQEINVAAAQSDTAVRQVFAGFEMDFEALNSKMPTDPFSEDYYEYQMALYKSISGKGYLIANEVSAFNVEDMVRRPFPFSSGSTITTGMHLSALGFVVSNLKLRPGARILEFGPGWGNTTLALALLGFKVTAVDIEANFCALIRERAALNGVDIEVKNADFFSCETIVEPYDAVLFYECFHHCSDHMRLLRGLHRAIKPTGRVFLGAEPIKADFPLPWGLRLDGESLWAIRQNGWMELGFSNAYFAEALKRTGWHGSFRISQDVGWANLWELENRFEQDIVVSVSDPSIHSQSGEPVGGLITAKATEPTYIVYGPRITLGEGDWFGVIHLKDGAERSGAVVIDVCSGFGTHIYASRDVDLGAMADQVNVLDVPFSLPEACNTMEVRLFSKSAATVCVETAGFLRVLPNQPPPMKRKAVRKARALASR